MDSKARPKLSKMQQAEITLFESEQRFRALVEHLGEGVAIVDVNKTFLFSNAAGEKIFGVAPGTLVGRNLFDLLSPSQVEMVRSQFNLRKAGKSSLYEIEIARPDGKIRHLSVTATPWLDKVGTLTGTFFIFRDITESLIAEEDLRQSEERYRAIVEDQSEIIFRFQSSGIITFVNEAFCRFWQRKREAVLGTNIMAYVPREDRAAIRSQFTSLTAACPAVTYEMSVQRSEGETRWLQRTDHAIFDDHGVVVEYQSVCSDISERRAAEQALKHQLALGEIVTDISTRFINIIPEEMENEIKRSLKITGEFAGVDRCFLVLLTPDASEVEDGYEWVSDRVGAPRPLIKRGAFPISEWLLNTIRRTDIISISSIYHLPDEANVEKEQWLQFGFKSLLGMPLMVENNLLGIYGLSMEQAEREWGSETHLMVRMVGEILINVLIRSKSLQALQSAQNQLSQRIHELEQRSREINLLSEMSNLLQIANQSDEAYAIITQSASLLFQGTSGCLYIFDPQTGLLLNKSCWGKQVPPSRVQMDDCWGLRRGRLYRASHAGLFCRHISTQTPPGSTICVPITAQSKTIGMLHVQTHPPTAPLSDANQPLASAVAEQIGLALSNLQLREDLRQQAIRDQLTGLYNRYYMEASLEQELNRAQRSGKPVSLIMLDIDHFKDFNDTYQHQAGDQLLHALGQLMINSIRAGDIACRYGGEEFLLILPETPLAAALQRAEHLRLLVKGMRLETDHHSFPPITISLGVACWPNHGLSVNDLLKAADDAMYKAKNNGRNQVASAG